MKDYRRKYFEVAEAARVNDLGVAVPKLHVHEPARAAGRRECEPETAPVTCGERITVAHDGQLAAASDGVT